MKVTVEIWDSKAGYEDNRSPKTVYADSPRDALHKLGIPLCDIHHKGHCDVTVAPLVTAETETEEFIAYES